MPKTNLTAEEVRSRLNYDAKTGNLIWIMPPKKMPNLLDKIAGHKHSSGYTAIGLARRGTFPAHRLVWLWVHGEWPKSEIDHINGDRSDNRIENLREVNRSVNCENIRSAHNDNKTGILGVSWDKARKRYYAQIGISGKTINLGRFQDPETASQAYLAAKRKLHKGCTI